MALPAVVEQSRRGHQTPFTASVEVAVGVKEPRKPKSSSWGRSNGSKHLEAVAA